MNDLQSANIGYYMYTVKMKALAGCIQNKSKNLSNHRLMKHVKLVKRTNNLVSAVRGKL